MESVAHFRILEPLGTGPLGDLFRARDTRLGRTVAIRVVRPELIANPSDRSLFLEAAHRAAAISHPNIAALFEVGQDKDRIFLVFEFVSGRTLREAIGERPLGVRTTVEIGIQLADALAEAHAQGGVDGNLNPETVLITQKGHAKILEFGLGPWAAAPQAAAAGAPPDTVRPSAYRSPEQVLGEPGDFRTDIFSLGALLFEMLTGRPAFGQEGGQTDLAILRNAPPAPSSINAEVPPELDQVVGRALAKSLEGRYGSAAALAAELRSVAAVLDLRAQAEVPQQAPAVAKTRSRRPALPVAAVVVVLASAAAAWLLRGDIARWWARWFVPAPPPVVALAPFVLEGGDESGAYFTEGLTEEIAGRLALVPGISVRARSAIRAFGHRDPAAIARDSGASAVLTGSLRRLPDRLALSVALVRPSDGVAVWQQDFEQTPRNLLALEQDVVDGVAARFSIRARQRGPSAALRLVDARAYDLYLKGRASAARGDLPQAIALYERAVGLDPGLAEAHAALARALYRRARTTGRLGDPATRQRIADRAKAAADIESGLPEAQIALGLAAPTLAERLACWRRAVALDPSSADAWTEIGNAILGVDPDRALGFYRRALAVDRLSGEAHAGAAVASIMLNRLPAAEREIAAGRSSDTSRAEWSSLEAIVRLKQQRAADAADGMKRQPPRDEALRAWQVYVTAFEAAGRVAEAREAGETTAQRYRAFCSARAMAAGLRADAGDKSAAQAAVREITDAAAQPNVPPDALTCAVVASAALGDAAASASWLTRVAAREDALLAWTGPINGMSDDFWLTERWYPFGKIAEDPAVLAARAEVGKAIERLKADTAPALSMLASSRPVSAPSSRAGQ